MIFNCLHAYSRAQHRFVRFCLTAFYDYKSRNSNGTARIYNLPFYLHQSLLAKSQTSLAEIPTLQTIPTTTLRNILNFESSTQMPSEAVRRVTEESRNSHFSSPFSIRAILSSSSTMSSGVRFPMPLPFPQIPQAKDSGPSNYPAYPRHHCCAQEVCCVSWVADSGKTISLTLYFMDWLDKITNDSFELMQLRSFFRFLISLFSITFGFFIFILKPFCTLKLNYTGVIENTEKSLLYFIPVTVKQLR